jgi:hypothetical protein
MSYESALNRTGHTTLPTDSRSHSLCQTQVNPEGRLRAFLRLVTIGTVTDASHRNGQPRYDFPGWAHWQHWHHMTPYDTIWPQKSRFLEGGTAPFGPKNARSLVPTPRTSYLCFCM